MAFKSKYSSSEVEGLLDKVNGMGDTGITKEQVENVLTGNILTHRHDATYVMNDYDTDVWDGTSISTSLQGSGTKEDPYLIQSCSDWLHLRLNPGQYNIYGQSDLGNAAEFKPYFKLNKNLDFGNKTIPELDISSVEQSLMCVFDGSGAKLSNFVDSQGTGILPVCSYYFAHDFVIDNFQTTSDVRVDVIPVFSVMDLYSTIINCTVNADITITGTLSESKELPIVLSGEYTSFMENNFATEVNEYIENNGCLSGIDINITDNTVKSNGAKLAANIAFSYLVHPIVCYITTPLTGVDYSSGSPETVSDFSISSILAGVSPSCLYTNSEGDNKMYVHVLEGENTTFTGTPKSLTEMKSASFVEELNSKLPKPAFKQDPNGGTPVLIQGNQAIDYDGYVKQSVFDTTVEEINSSIAGNKTVVFSDVNFFQEKTTGSQQQKFFVEDNFIEELGGLEKAKELFDLILDQSKIIRGMMFAYVVPYIYDVTSKILFNQTKSNTVVPEDGDSFYMQLGAFVAMGTSSANEIPYSLTTTVNVTNFNKENMTVKIDRATKSLVSSDSAFNILEKTQTEYDSLETKDSQTLYLITE